MGYYMNEKDENNSEKNIIKKADEELSHLLFHDLNRSEFMPCIACSYAHKVWLEYVLITKWK